MIQREDLEMCKKDIEACIGKKVRLKTNGGRKRTIIREGIVEDCYPKVFTVRCIRKSQDDPELVTYSYIDILTDTVEIAVEPEAAEIIQENYAKLEEAIKKENEAIIAAKKAEAEEEKDSEVLED